MLQTVAVVSYLAQFAVQFIVAISRLCQTGSSQHWGSVGFCIASAVLYEELPGGGGRASQRQLGDRIFSHLTN